MSSVMRSNKSTRNNKKLSAVKEEANTLKIENQRLKQAMTQF